jgi:hypothetical protein
MNSELTHLTKDQATRVDRAKSYWQSEIRSGRGVGIYAFMLGAELTTLKQSLKDDASRGQWMTFRETHFPEIPHRTATERMALFSKLAESANLPPAGNIKLLGDGSIPKDYADKIAEAWCQHAEGKTITRFMRDTGVIREKQLPAHHPIKPRTPDEIIAAENAVHESALIDLENAVAYALNLLDGMSKCIPTHRLKQHLRIAVSWTKAIRPLTKRKLSPAEKKDETKAKAKALLAAVTSCQAALADKSDLVAESRKRPEAPSLPSGEPAFGWEVEIEFHAGSRKPNQTFHYKTPHSTTAASKAMLNRNAYRVVKFNPLTEEQYVRAYGIGRM